MNPFRDLTFGASLRHLAATFGRREALVFKGRRWKFSDVKDEVDAAARRLGTLGLSQGDKVALWLPNRPEFLWYWLAAGQIGLVAVMLNTRLKREEATYQLGQSDSRAVILPGPGAFRDFLGEVMAIRADLPKLRHVVALDPPGPGAAAHILDWSGATDPSLPLPEEARDPEAPVLIAYSSGTTALPKGAMLTHCLFRKAWDHGPRFGQTEDDRLFLCVPLFGILSTVNGVLTFWSRGSAVVLTERFEPREALQLLQEERCTAAYLLPLMLDQMLAEPDFRKFDLSRLRTGIVVATDPAVLRRAASELGMHGLITSFGMTETSSAVTRTFASDPLEVRATSHGTELPDIEVRVADPETNAPLPDDTYGELQVRGYCVMKGYYNKPEETARSFTPDGWFKTGDGGVRRADGTFQFQRRLKDGYKYNGFNVSTPEVEAVLSQHPEVQAVAVFGLPDRSHGEVGTAFVIPRPGTAIRLDPSSVIEFLKPRLASYKIPKHVFVVEEFPLTAGTGKVQKFKLREIAEARLAGAVDHA
ncbi:MAG: AMP-binding protein [Alphaproteobacteria bacterium]|nr:AMP-binding protein [Alphaproteobacteria bacterium]